MDDARVILITSTSKGIGKYLAQYYAENGCQVLGCSRSPVEFSFENYQHFCLDISDEKEVKNMFREIQKTYGRLDVLINNAGIIAHNYIMLTPLKNVQKIMDTNFMGVFLTCREATKLMQKKRCGRIVNFSSVAVPMAKEGTAFYSASKAAVEQFSKVLAKEVGPCGITVNSLALTFVEDSGMAGQASEKAIKETLDYSILKSCLKCKDVSNAIDFLISPEANMITGHVLPLGGF